MKQMKKQKTKKSPMIKEIFKDKNGFFNMREIVTAIMVVMVIGSWIGEQFFGFALSEYMFFGFISLIGAGCFGYSIERKQRYLDKPENSPIMNLVSDFLSGFSNAARKKPVNEKENETNVEFEKQEEQ